MKKAIAMKCSQEDWDSIKDRITLPIKLNSETFDQYCWITNDRNQKGVVANLTHPNNLGYDRVIYETFNAKIFLEACGIEFEKKFEITKDQILKLSKYTSLANDWFPEVFKKELETGYYKHKNGEHPKWFCYVDISTGRFYGHGNIGWMTGSSGMVEYIEENCEPMTPQEVETALIGEAKKKGYKNGIIVNSFVHNKNLQISHCHKIEYISGDYDKLHFGEDGHNCVVVYEKGKWATIIDTITIQEAEKLLNKKIV